MITLLFRKQRFSCNNMKFTFTKSLFCVHICIATRTSIALVRSADAHESAQIGANRRDCRQRVPMCVRPQRRERLSDTK